MHPSQRLLGLAFALVALSSTACPEEDVTPEPASLLCSGPGCVNAPECPGGQPEAGEPCTFIGNCHYCQLADLNNAFGYNCDGEDYAYVGVFDCTP